MHKVVIVYPVICNWNYHNHVIGTHAILYYREVWRAACEFSIAGCYINALLINNEINLSAGKHEQAEIIIHNSFQDNLDLDTVAYNTCIKAMLGAGKSDIICI